MSTKKPIPPIQPAPFQRFTVRLVDGHFVRVPKLENIATTDATRPPTVLSPGAARAAKAAVKTGDGSVPRGMRMVNGRLVRVIDLAADRSGEAPTPAPAAPPKPAATKQTPTEDWAMTFGTQMDPSGSPSEP